MTGYKHNGRNAFTGIDAGRLVNVNVYDKIPFLSIGSGGDLLQRYFASYLKDVFALIVFTVTDSLNSTFKRRLCATVHDQK